eukprot:scaffold59435_cov43-Attheya_sp.AAC.2
MALAVATKVLADAMEPRAVNMVESTARANCKLLRGTIVGGMIGIWGMLRALGGLVLESV